MENTSGNMQVRVKNFGPIYKANFDLRPLSVFVGPSNTGKTYLAVLIYALHQYFGDFRNHPLASSSFPPMERTSHLKAMTGQNKAKKVVVEQLKRSIQTDSEMKSIMVPSDLINYKVDDEYDLREEMCRCFGRDRLSSFFRLGGKKNKTSIELEKKIHDSLIYKYDAKLQENKIKVDASISGDLSLPVDESEMLRILENGRLYETRDEYFDWMFSSLVDRTIRRFLAFPLHLPAFYLPAGRTGIMNAHKTVVSSLLTRASMEGILPTNRTPTMSSVLANFMEQLLKIDLRQDHRVRKSYKHNSVWKNIETKILKGKVNFVTDQSIVKYPDFTYRPHGWPPQLDDLPMMHVSSMVSELASVVLFLKHVVVPNDLIIIEEPEAHLHPAMQVEFTKQLAVLVNSGINVLVTTHSEWILEELANIIKRSDVSDHDSTALQPEKVGTWLFGISDRPKGTIVKEIKLDDDSGLYPSGFDEVSISLHNEWAKISDQANNKT